LIIKHNERYPSIKRKGNLQVFIEENPFNKCYSNIIAFEILRPGKLKES